ncbi:MAG: tellurite resistance TerB family protein [Marinibacterium sp.]|nr:tellurite resistance TerB family protein [Marinibacterium sp.]
MSFVRALAGVAMGFAAAKGVESYRQMGGMTGLQDAMKNAGSSPMADQLGQLADQFGVPGGSRIVKDMLGQMGNATLQATEAGAAGLSSLMNSMQGAAAASTAQTTDMMAALFGNTGAADAAEQQAKFLIRAMIQAAKADGEIDPQEQQVLIAHLGNLGPDEIAFVKAELAAPADLQGLLNDAAATGREQIYATSLGAIRVDNAAESAYLRQLASGLGLSDADRDAIHARMGLPPLQG